MGRHGAGTARHADNPLRTTRRLWRQGACPPGGPGQSQASDHRRPDGRAVGAADNANPFLNPKDFEGTPALPASRVVLGGQSIYNGRIVFSNLARDVVAGALATNLRLAANKRFPKLHPVIFLFGHQTDTSWEFSEGELNIGVDYMELIVIIPFVQFQGDRGWHNYVVRMFLDDFAATTGGNLFFGYRKVLASLRDDPWDNVFGVRKIWFVDDAFHASISDVGEWCTDTQANRLPNYRHLKAIFDMPVLGTKESILPGPKNISSFFDWNFKKAKVRPITSRHSILDSFGTGINAWVALGEIPTVTSGGFEVDGLVWRLGSPVPLTDSGIHAFDEVGSLASVSRLLV